MAPTAQSPDSKFSTPKLPVLASLLTTREAPGLVITQNKYDNTTHPYPNGRSPATATCTGSCGTKVLATVLPILALLSILAVVYMCWGHKYLQRRRREREEKKVVEQMQLEMRKLGGGSGAEEWESVTTAGGGGRAGSEAEGKRPGDVTREAKPREGDAGVAA